MDTKTGSYYSGECVTVNTTVEGIPFIRQVTGTLGELGWGEDIHGTLHCIAYYPRGQSTVT